MLTTESLGIFQAELGDAADERVCLSRSPEFEHPGTSPGTDPEMKGWLDGWQHAW